MKIGGDVQKAILKDLQRHPAKDRVMHADFLRIDEKVALKVNIPIHFVNEESCRGVKLEGGIIEHQSLEIEVLCLPSAIPEYIEVDMADIGLGDSVHLSDVTLPEGVESVALSYGEDHDEVIASVIQPRGLKSDEEEDEEAAEAPAADDVPSAQDEGEDEASED